MPDNLTIEQRRRAMQAVKGSNTTLEVRFAAALRREGLKARRNVVSLPGKPDFVFNMQRLIVFVDGDFWHGWRFPIWAHKLAPYWRNKIEKNRKRYRSTHQRLRRKGWKVLRVWEHQVHHHIEDVVCLVKLMLAIEK